jgi:Dolichyl-phosphate-mannose-protein mannosyltransferase
LTRRRKAFTISALQHPTVVPESEPLMDESPNSMRPSPETAVESLRLDWPDWRLIAILALVTFGLRTYQLCTTEVTARDSISYIHIAWRLEHGDWRQVIRDSPQHPGYPIAVLAASLPARLFFPNDLPYAMQLGAQLASAAASILLVAPLFWMGRQLFNRRIGFWAVLVFQCLPCSGRIMADGLSEGVFLLFALTALAFAMYSLQAKSIVGFALAGAASGLAYLTRPEGLLISAAAGLTLLGMQVFRNWRRSWLTVGACGAALTTAVLLVSGPYMFVIGGLTVKTTGNALMKDATAEADHPVEAPLDGVARGPALLAVWWRGDAGVPSGRYLWGLQTLAEVLSKAFFFVLWIPALAGLVTFRDRFRTVPGAWMLLLVCVLLGGVLYRVAVRMGYLSDRHTILILACGVLWATAAVEAAARGLAKLLANRSSWLPASVGAAALLLVVTVAPLWRTLEPLHGDRVGFRAAGHWLAEHAGPQEAVFDPFGWSGYYAGRYFQDGPGQEPWAYVVIEESTNNKHSHLVTMPEAEKLARRGVKMCSFPAPRGKESAEVVIYYLTEERSTGFNLGQLGGVEH